MQLDRTRVAQLGALVLAAFLLTGTSLCDLEALESGPHTAGHDSHQAGHLRHDSDHSSQSGSPADEADGPCCRNFRAVRKDGQPNLESLASGPAPRIVVTAFRPLEVHVPAAIAAVETHAILFQTLSPAYFLASPAHAPPAG